MLDTELVYSQCDMSWLYHSLEKATEAITKCESGLQFWKLFTTPAWSNLVKYCDSLDKYGVFDRTSKKDVAIQNRSKLRSRPKGRKRLTGVVVTAITDPPC